MAKFHIGNSQEKLNTRKQSKLIEPEVVYIEIEKPVVVEKLVNQIVEVEKPIIVEKIVEKIVEIDRPVIKEIEKTILIQNTELEEKVKELEVELISSNDQLNITEENLYTYRVKQLHDNKRKHNLMKLLRKQKDNHKSQSKKLKITIIALVILNLLTLLLK